MQVVGPLVGDSGLMRDGWARHRMLASDSVLELLLRPRMAMIGAMIGLPKYGGDSKTWRNPY